MLNSGLDWGAIQNEYATHGKVVIPDILNPETAAAVADAITGIDQWDLNCSGREDAVIMPEGEFIALPAEKKTEVARVLMLAAQTGYAFHFYQHKLDDTPDPVLADFYAKLLDEKFLGFIKYVTGEFGIAGRVGMATEYRPACFLRTHSDRGASSDRLFAYVFGFTRNWNPDWGGTLNFVDDTGAPARVVNPAFNTLTLFKVPTDHFVVQVANYATTRRHSITGWFLKA